MAEFSVTTLAGLIGLGIGLLFGGITQRTNFCTMGAVADVVSFSDYGRARAWLLAIAVAIIGAQSLQLTGLIDLKNSIYLGSSLNWLGGIIGGLIFGFGMVLASGCPGRNLARVGGGDLKALVVPVDRRPRCLHDAARHYRPGPPRTRRRNQCRYDSTRPAGSWRSDGGQHDQRHVA